MSDCEMLKAHVDLCSECSTSAFGLCSRGFALLGRISRMRDEHGQLTLLEVEPRLESRPLARMAWQQLGRRSCR